MSFSDLGFLSFLTFQKLFMIIASHMSFAHFSLPSSGISVAHVRLYDFPHILNNLSFVFFLNFFLSLCFLLDNFSWPIFRNSLCQLHYWYCHHHYHFWFSHSYNVNTLMKFPIWSCILCTISPRTISILVIVILNSLSYSSIIWDLSESFYVDYFVDSSFSLCFSFYLSCL